MKRMLMALLLCLLVYCGANAETVMEGEVSTITFTYQDYQNQALNDTFYFSDDEIWFIFENGTTDSVLVRFNADGQVMDEWRVQTITGEDPRILCMNRVDGNALLGCMDFNSFRGEVIVFDQSQKEIARNTLPKNVIINQMRPTQRGMLVLGATDDGESKGSFYLTEIDSLGQVIFEKQIPFTKEPGALWYATESHATSDGENFYLLAKTGMAGTLMAKEQLICLDQRGEMLWMVELPASFYTNDLAVMNGSVYLVGVAGERDEYGCLINQRSAIIRYATDGTRQWQMAYPEVSGRYTFYHVAVGMENCYAISNGNEGQAYAVEIEADGSIGMLKHLVLDGGLSAVNERGQLVFLGDQGDELFIRTVE